MKRVKLKDVKRGDFVKRKKDAKKVFVRGDYDRSAKRYALDDWDDIGRTIYIKGNVFVYTGFEF